MNSSMATTHSQMAETERIDQECRTTMATSRTKQALQSTRRSGPIQGAPGWGRFFIRQERKSCSQKYKIPTKKARKAPVRCVDR